MPGLFQPENCPTISCKTQRFVYATACPKQG